VSWLKISHPSWGRRLLVSAKPGRPDRLTQLFDVGVVLKALDGGLEIIGSLLLLLLPTARLQSLVVTLTQHELSQDPHDFVATHLLHYSAKLNGHSLVFAALYLLSHGLAKVGLSAGLLRRWAWAYPATLVFLAAFIAYQLYRLSGHFGWGLSLLTIFDVALFALTWYEYRVRKASMGSA
jgi:uncharacterized membrane protein